MRRATLLFLVAWLLSGCSEPQPSAQPTPPRPVRLVVLGSSTAAGFGLKDPAEGWVARYRAFLLAQDPGNEVINLAVSGYTTYQVLPTGTEATPGRPSVDPEHNVTAALAQKPRAILVNLPSNDAAFSYPVEETMTNLKLVVAEAGKAGVAVWVATSQPRKLDAARTALLLGLRDRTLADFGGRALDFWTPLAASDGSPKPDCNQGDGIHPNGEGHRLLFEQVRAAAIPAALQGR